MRHHPGAATRAVGVNFVHQSRHMVGVHVRRHAVPQIEYMPLAATAVAIAIAIQHRAHLRAQRSGAAVQHRRIQIALQGHLALCAPCRIVHGDGPVHAHAFCAAGSQCFQMRGIALAKQDQRGICTLELTGDAGQVRQRKFLIHRRRQRAAPGVEHLQHLRACGVLRCQIRNDGIGNHMQQLVHRCRLIQGQRLDLAPFLAAATFHHVTSQGPWAAGKTNQRHLGVQFAADQRHCIHHIAQRAAHIGHRQFFDVGNLAQRAFELGALAFGVLAIFKKLPAAARVARYSGK